MLAVADSQNMTELCSVTFANLSALGRFKAQACLYVAQPERNCVRSSTALSAAAALA